jgi:hypothetical protein
MTGIFPEKRKKSKKTIALPGKAEYTVWCDGTSQFANYGKGAYDNGH